MIRFVFLYPFLVLTTLENNRQIIALNILGTHYPPVNYTIIVILLLIIY